MTRALRALAGTTLALGAAAACAAWDLSSTPATSVERAAAFQTLTGGLGAGRAIDPVACAAAFDPRIDDQCADRLEPIPGGGMLCPCLGSPLPPTTR